MDKWKPRELDKKAIAKKLQKVSYLSKKLENGIGYNSILCDLDYGEMADLVAELYNDMDIESLAQDTIRRQKEVKRKVAEAEKNK